ncbi:hypothetical protein [Methylocystis parvus]|uniref:hypothetical protein n=1 Tax=Methylocystis parvus TaxID=134 RepID=UPI003C71EB83
MKLIDQTCANLVPHGRMACDRCWKNVTTNVQEAGPFRLVRDPGHWGSSTPSTLVLGVSKGNTQSNAFATSHFDAVAFMGIRGRLLQVLQTVGLLQGETVTAFEQRFCRDEQEYAFASVVRCSLTGMDRKKRIHTADSPNVIPAFKEGSAGYGFTSECVDQHLGKLPDATQRVVLLGNTDAYIEHLRAVVGRSRGSLRKINDVAYSAGGVMFVHVSHPSKGNRHFGAFLRGEGIPGEKMRMAREAIKSA